MMVVYAEDRLESSDLSHFLLDLSNVFHIPPWHQYCVSRLFPPYQALTTYICGFSQGREGSICAQGLQGMTVNVQDRSGPDGVWPLWREFITVARNGFQLPLPAAPIRQQQAAPVPRRQGAWLLRAILPAQSWAPRSQAVAMHLGAGGESVTGDSSWEGPVKKPCFQSTTQEK